MNFFSNILSPAEETIPGLIRSLGVYDCNLSDTGMQRGQLAHEGFGRCPDGAVQIGARGKQLK
jgi:hypothetical protein